jgi:hypothetical protein
MRFTRLDSESPALAPGMSAIKFVCWEDVARFVPEFTVKSRLPGAEPDSNCTEACAVTARNSTTAANPLMTSFMKKFLLRILVVERTVLSAGILQTTDTAIVWFPDNCGFMMPFFNLH